MSNEVSNYDRIGGEAKLRFICQKFYTFMDQDPEAQEIRKMHPQDLKISEDKLFDFLSGWLGGPPLFQQKHGAPMLRARHLPFKIGKEERDAWMRCMVYAFEEAQVPDPLRSQLLYNLLRLADHMRNQPEGMNNRPPS